MNKLLRFTVIASSLVGLLGCSKAETSGPNQTIALSNDFFVTVVQKGNEFRKVTPLDIATPFTRATCEAALTKAVCETTASTGQITNNYASVKCTSNSAQYVPALMNLFDETPELMRASLCSLDRIFLSDNIASTAFASSVTDMFGRRTGGYVGMRRATFLQQPSSHDLVSWKEQLAFGGSSVFLANDPKLVQIRYNIKLTTLKSDGLFYVLMHELGHLIDFNNSVNSERGSQTGWARLSWDAMTQTPLSQASFYKRDDFCFYNCRSYLDARDAKEIYSSLTKSAFISTYASQNPYEDFAEFWAWHLLIQNKSPQLQIEIPGEAKLELNDEFTQNPQIKAKLDFVDQLWNSSDLKVDNRQGPNQPPN